MAAPVSHRQYNEEELWNLTINDLDPHHRLLFRLSLPIPEETLYRQLSSYCATTLYEVDEKGFATMKVLTKEIPKLQKVAACFRKLIFDKSIPHNRLNWILFFLDLKMSTFAKTLLDAFATKENIGMYEYFFVEQARPDRIEREEAQAFINVLKERFDSKTPPMG